MKTICWLLIVATFAGCELTTQPNNPDGKVKPSPIVERAPADEVWRSLAHAVDAGQITSTNRLAQFVVVLARNGDLSAKDVAAFDATFPGATKTDRALGSDDSAKLKGIE